MKRSKYIFIGIIVVLIIVGIIFRKNFYNSISYKDNTNTEYTRTSTEENIKSENSQNTNSDNYNTSSIQEQPNANSIESKVSEPSITPTPLEEDLSNFSTKIYSKDPNRQNNLRITSEILNGKVVESGNTFSFTETIGKATSKRGYKEADIYDKDGNKIKGYGGGNCQVSSTLYNAVLLLPPLKVTERHPHSKKVPYVKEGKDAAVAYGSIDFKFVNNYDFSIKIYCTVDSNNISVRIVKLS